MSVYFFSASELGSIISVLFPKPSKERNSAIWAMEKYSEENAVCFKAMYGIAVNPEPHSAAEIAKCALTPVKDVESAKNLICLLDYNLSTNEGDYLGSDETQNFLAVLEQLGKKKV
jgi:hypothetical protein